MRLKFTFFKEHEEIIKLQLKNMTLMYISKKKIVKTNERNLKTVNLEKNSN
ncbi:hypothetical protein STFR1_50260 [Bacillus vallismortis]